MHTEATMIEVKKYLDDEAPELKHTSLANITEWKEFWQSLTEQEKTEYKQQVAKELGR